jgi:hypothetical protein
MVRPRRAGARRLSLPGGAVSIAVFVDARIEPLQE